ncbi:hypothetical protein BDD21_5562 [Thiocapsa rosea]|uniref:Uncharacterized protein n=1 Tax=Thiocapsa rosea TaxID=69360 RepID=A0A495UPS8_9GAMM|nr:hypothetical protein BDD21_5562 [Thiocapsa rosea]
MLPPPRICGVVTPAGLQLRMQLPGPTGSQIAMEKGADLGRANVDRGLETRSTDFTLREGFKRLTH